MQGAAARPAVALSELGTTLHFHQLFEALR